MSITGLNENEVNESRRLHGCNKLPEPPLKTWKDFAIDTLKDRITLILIAIAVVQGVFSIFGLFEVSEPLMILVVLGVVVSIGVKTNLGIQKSNNELKEKTSRRYCSVIRDGKVKQINKDELVVGDLVLLETGSEIYADGYIVDGSISVSNAAINGESKECRKTPIDGYVPVELTSTDDYTNQNCLFAGTTIMSGEGKMIVTSVGVNTVNGDTLVKMQTLEAPKTSLQIALDNLADFISKWGTIAAFTAFVVMTISGIVQIGFSEYFGDTPLEAFRVIATNFSVAMTIIVAAVPEGLPLIIQLVTKQNVKTMEKFNILAKNPNKIPELANVNLICTDKTGTLTTGVMTPKRFILGNGKDVKLEKIPDPVIRNVILNNSSKYDEKDVIIGGNSIDRAILTLANAEVYWRVKDAFKEFSRQPFNSEYKYSAVTWTNEDGEMCTFYKGAPEKIIDCCSYFIDENGRVSELSNDVRKKLDDQIKQLTSCSMRCIAMAVSNDKLAENVLPNELTLQGVFGVVDPVRQEVPYAVKKAHEAGIQVIEITGDCIETAVAIAKESGIYGKPGDIAITDKEFTDISDDKVKEILPRLRVIARCSPSTKLRLVTLAQEIGYSVAMTGDGTNDSPALKRSDVGFAMNAGTDVAKEAGDIILTDNNFASVVKGVELGRTFMHNIMMFLDFQLPINISLLIMNLLYPIFWIGTILTSVQILVVNIIMDSLNSLSFGGEPPKKSYMKESPIRKGSGLFIGDSKARIAVSTITFIFVYAVLLMSPLKKEFSSEQALAARFALLCVIAVLNGFNIRTDKINLLSGLNKNKAFVGIAIGIVIGAVVLTQFDGSLLHTTPLEANQWRIIFALSAVIVPVDIIRKILRKGRKDKNVIKFSKRAETTNC